ncbi:hypothetical protein BDV28DRAFT_148951 [Aspergillus coremiiformis]|uniref:Protein kinase domain-containing protein n=1 Tax=Aspergillus coremiiformis TaxID=138285 RepID=A0A5N6Z727_9EURO|nr:hypothetical protein BDV28DRAFT_148951 [Aspergillus coremiiformis]
METAHNLLARVIPELRFIGGTTEASVSNEILCASYMHHWASFETEVRDAHQHIDLSGIISQTDPQEGEFFLTGSELGLTGRFNQNVCEAVAKALSVTELRGMRFGDIQAAVSSTDCIPGVALMSFPNADNPIPAKSSLVAVGELKTFWTVRLEDHPVNGAPYHRVALEHPIGQVVSYMRTYSLRFGFLSTYKATVFIRRTADYRFELSKPFRYDARNPTLRECFLSFTSIAARDRTYIEGPDVHDALLRSRSAPGAQASPRPSPLRNHIAYLPSTTTIRSASVPATGSNLAAFQITPNAMLIGANGTADYLVTCIRDISRPKSRKSIFECDYNGIRCIAKCWTLEDYESFLNETYVYDKLFDKRPGGYDVFAGIVLYGEVICSSVFPSGYIMLLRQVGGEPLLHVWNTISNQDKTLVKDHCRKAIEHLRSVQIWVGDAGQHNVLFDMKTKKVTMIDFEVAGICAEDHLNEFDVPEMLDIFGPVIHSERIVGG